MNKKIIASLALVALLAGCAGGGGSDSSGSSNGTSSSQQYSGFLGDYSKLQSATSPQGAPVLRWISPVLKPGMYNSVMLVPSILYPRPQASAQVSVSVLNGITQQFDADLKAAVKSSGMKLVSTAGPGTLKISPAITAVNTANAPLAVYQYVPIAFVITSAARAAGAASQQVTAMVEMEAVDSQSGEVLGQVVRQGTGNELPNTDAQLSVSDMKSALQIWANDLSTQLQKFR